MRKGFIPLAGFTLIELLVVISIIGILAAMITISFASSQKQARDTTRKSDLSQYRSALEAYANQHNGLYPSEYTKIDPSTTNFCNNLLGLTSCPEDPKNDPNPPNDVYYYQYQSTGDASTVDTAAAAEYVLWTSVNLENSSSKWFVCSNGTSGQSSTGLPPNSGTGTCPK